MKKLLLTAMAAMALITANAQTNLPDTGFKPRKLKLDEINFISSYYQQDGDNAAVTGGTGSEKLTDIANNFELKFIRYDKKLRKHNLGFELGIDHYTSASSDKVDLKANSSASHADNRIYPALTWSMENEKKGSSISAGVSSSFEYDYTSFGGHIGVAQKTKNRMGEFAARVQVYIDQLRMIAPIELRTSADPEEEHGGIEGRNTYAASVSYSQIVNKNLQMLFLADVVQQQGYLSLPFHRVYFNDASVHQEKLPDSRFKIPLGVRANYFIGDKLIIRSYYRYYRDDWGLNAHTASLEIPYKFSPFFSVSPFYRFYAQSAIDYFKPYKAHDASEEFFTSNYDLSKFSSHFFGAGIRLSPEKGILGIRRINLLELRLAHYLRSTGLNANIVSLHIRFK